MRTSGSGGRTAGIDAWSARASRLAFLLAALALAAPATALGGDKPREERREEKRDAREERRADSKAPKRLRESAKSAPDEQINVIVSSAPGVSATELEAALSRASAGTEKPRLKRQFTRALRGAAVSLTGAQLTELLEQPEVAVVVRDAPVAASSQAPSYTNTQLWPEAAGTAAFWTSSAATPAIAIVDTGIDASRAADFGGRVVGRATFYSAGGTNSSGDGRGHGTLVAGIAAGAAAGYAGVAPTANLVDVDVLGDDGSGVMSDVVAAADWILANKSVYGIRVANFSLHGSSDSSFMFDPVNHAVERLWFAGVVVVTAAGNYAENGAASGVRYAPANDPFVITVGAADIAGTASPGDDFNAPWSSHGHTSDGFRKPELAAPGRFMRGPVSSGASLYGLLPDRVVEPGYMWMSGTSFAAPVVAGAAAQALAAHPSWTPDQVKGALMLTAQPGSADAGGALGVGLARGAAAASVVDPPNPNLALNEYVTTGAAGDRSFNTDAWSQAAQANPSWNSASWASASWASASWASASWASASWASASWASASWASASWASASWASTSLASSAGVR